MFTALVWRYLSRFVPAAGGKNELIPGTAWHEYQPPTDKEKSFKLLDAYVAAGGNFFDTANGYSVSSAKFTKRSLRVGRGERDNPW
jgi:aryl-alcohol dehydrogenase-like predicted oxidoreductase